MPKNAQPQTIIHGYNDRGADFPDFDDEAVTCRIIGNGNTGEHIVEITSWDGSEPSDHSAVANTSKVPIGSDWISRSLTGDNANKRYEKTGASTWTKLSAV